MASSGGIVRKNRSGEAIVIHRCAECGYYEGESPQGGCCPNCGTASDPIPVMVKEVGRV